MNDSLNNSAAKFSRSLLHFALQNMFVALPALCISNFALADTVQTSATNIHKLKTIKKYYKSLKVGEKNIPSAMSIIGSKKIKNASSSSSIYSLLKDTPSVNEYQQNIGASTPVFSIRGVRASELALTLDGVPIQSLLNGGIGVLNSYNVGSIVSLGQIEKIHVYPGVAPPDRAGFATIGGTVSYQAKKPSKTRSAQVFASIGSFSTDKYGVEVNTGTIKNGGGLRMMIRYTRTTTSGYIQHTPAEYDNLYFSMLKPYDYGLSKLSAIMIDNRATGELQTFGGIPQPLQNLNGFYTNYPLSQTMDQEKNSFITAIIGDRTYINRNFVVGGKLFYINKSGRSLMYSDPNDINSPYPYQQDFYLPLVEDGPVGIPGYPSNDFSYNPVATFGNVTSGEDSAITKISSTTFGITPKLMIFAPHNAIVIGALIAHETGTNAQYIYGSLNMPEINGFNAFTYGTRESRTVYSGYIQDKIHLLHNTLNIEPGVTITGVATNNYVPQNIYDTPPYGYALSSFNKALDPYIGLAYDLSRSYIAYASFGRGTRFAPISDYTLGVTGSTTVVPDPEYVDAYEAGIRYLGKRLYVNLDGYFQHVKDSFSFTTIPAEDFSFYNNGGSEELYGLELSSKYALTHHLDISTNLSYNKTRYLSSYFAEDDPSASSYGYVAAGQPEADVPNWLANAAVTYHKGSFSGTLDASYTGSETALKEMPTTDDVVLNGVSDYEGYVPYPSITFGNYVLLNGNVNYKLHVNNKYLHSLDLRLTVDNILNRQYYVHYDYGFKVVSSPEGYVPASGSYGWGYPGMPRFFELSISASFL